MDRDRMSGFIGNAAMTIVDAMAKIDSNAKGILFIIDGQGSLCGCITDGDIRRWIMGAGDIHVSVCEAMARSPRYLFYEERAKAGSVIRKNSIRALPILDRERCIIDIILDNESGNQSILSKKKDLSDVPVVIMAGGKGTRLYPYTKILPKPLIPIGDTPIVERIINRFVEYDISKYYMTLNHKKGMIKSYFENLDTVYEIKYVEEPKPLGTAGSIKLIPDALDKPLFVTNCDVLILTDYSDIYDYHVNSGNEITIVSALKNITVPYGVIHVGDNGNIQSIDEKPRLSYFVNTGMYVINPETIGLIPDDTIFHMTHLVDEVMKKGGKVGMYPVSEDSFLDMGEFGEMERMEEKLNIVSER